MTEVINQEREILVQDGFVTVVEAAQFLGLSRSTLYNLMETGELVYAKIRDARRIPRRALIEFAAKSLKGGHGEMLGG
jgi:excisionase family DNA binding protein